MLFLIPKITLLQKFTPHFKILDPRLQHVVGLAGLPSLKGYGVNETANCKAARSQFIRLHQTCLIAELAYVGELVNHRKLVDGGEFTGYHQT